MSNNQTHNTADPMAVYDYLTVLTLPLLVKLTVHNIPSISLFCSLNFCFTSWNPQQRHGGVGQGNSAHRTAWSWNSDNISSVACVNRWFCAAKPHSTTAIAHFGNCAAVFSVAIHRWNSSGQRSSRRKSQRRHFGLARVLHENHIFASAQTTIGAL